MDPLIHSGKTLCCFAQFNLKAAQCNYRGTVNAILYLCLFYKTNYLLSPSSNTPCTEDLTISCRGSYSPEYDVVHLDCDSTRPLTTTQCQLDDGTVTDCETLECYHTKIIYRRILYESACVHMYIPLTYSIAIYN